MNDLPIKTSNNFFIKIKYFIKKLFKNEKQVKYEQETKVISDVKQDFQENIRIQVMENEALEKIDMQRRRNDLLEKFAENTELLNYLSMEELIQLEKMYDEELEKMANVV